MIVEIRLINGEVIRGLVFTGTLPAWAEGKGVVLSKVTEANTRVDPPIDKLALFPFGQIKCVILLDE